MKNRTGKIVFALSFFSMIFLTLFCQANAALRTSVPDLCNEPSGDWLLMENDFVNGNYVQFGEEGGECVMNVPQAPVSNGVAFQNKRKNIYGLN